MLQVLDQVCDLIVDALRDGVVLRVFQACMVYTFFLCFHGRSFLNIYLKQMMVKFHMFALFRRDSFGSYWMEVHHAHFWKQMWT
jgi:hypothetical protein